MSAVKFFDKATCRDVRRGFPRVVRIGISFPFDQILELILDTTRIEDVFDFEIFMIILNISGRRCGGKSMGRKCGFDGV